MTAFYMSLDEATKKRLEKIAEETGRQVWELCTAAVEEAALRAFRNRADDPAKDIIP